MKLCSSQYIHLYLRLFLWFVGILFLLCSSYTVRRNFLNWSTLLWKGRALVSQLDGGFHEQYFAYEWTIVQAIFWHYQTFSSIFWVFFTSQLSSVFNSVGRFLSFRRSFTEEIEVWADRTYWDKTGGGPHRPDRALLFLQPHWTVWEQYLRGPTTTTTRPDDLALPTPSILLLVQWDIWQESQPSALLQM